MGKPGFIQINMPVTVKFPKAKSFRTIIQEVWPDRFAVLAPGLDEVFLNHGEEIGIFCYREDARYEFFTRVIDYLPSKPPLYILRNPEKYDRVQSRNHVRVKASLKYRYALWSEEDYPHNPPALNKQGMTIDISAGGAQLIMKEPVEFASLLYLELELPGKKQQLPMYLAGLVRRVIVREVEGLKLYHVGVAFIDIHVKLEDRITAFVFQQMLNIRRQRS